MDTMSEAADPDYWVQKWDINKIGWHRAQVNPWLSANVKVLTGGRDNLKIFVPLCGKSLDMKWLADLGHHVVGVEVSRKACEEFFTDLNIAYSTASLESCDGTVYKSEDGRIQIFCCSIFDFNSQLSGLFDAVWDRGSMVALPPELMEKYHGTMEPLMAEGCIYILERLDYVIPGKTGPPHCVPMDTIVTYFGPNCNIEVLGRFESPADKEKFEAVSFILEMIQITKKS